MRVAIVHDWLVVYGGAERVLEHIIDCYPDADLFSLIDFVPDDQRHFLRGKTPRTSFIQKLPGAQRLYRKLLPLLPLAIEQFDLSGYDLIISSSYCVAKGVLTGPNQVHVSYCHSPMRYAWDHYHEYLRESGLERGPLSWFARWQLHRIRTWDVRSSNTVDAFIANSRFVQARIRKYYRRDAALVYPPVETGLFQLEREKQEFYVAAGRFVPFKRLDIAVDAFTQMPDKRLIMIGDGPEMDRLRRKAGSNVEFIGFQPPAVMRDYLSAARAFIFPSEEDFGIVPVEAQACGTPVIAFASGGALETVKPLTEGQSAAAATGVFFEEQTADSLIEAVARFERHRGGFDPVAISQHAARFSPGAFRELLVETVNAAVQARRYLPHRASARLPLRQPLGAALTFVPQRVRRPIGSGAPTALALRVGDGPTRRLASAGARLQRLAPLLTALTARRLKRVLDVCVAASMLTALSPVLLTTALLIRAESPGSPLFRQTRIGLRGRPFTLFKFRSMYRDAASRLAALANQNEMQGGVIFKMQNDPRVTRIGRWIRRTSIDELPQLFNVLRGDMSLVGPRPPLPAEVAQYSVYELGRLDAVPGLTCIWQVSGRSSIPFRQQVEMDLDYIHDQSLAEDVRLLARTVPALLRARGAY